MSKWNYALDIKQYLGGVTSSEGIVNAAHGVVSELRRLPAGWIDSRNDTFDDELDNVLYKFEEIAQMDHGEEDNEHLLKAFNAHLAMLYDWADDKRVWLGL